MEFPRRYLIVLMLFMGNVNFFYLHTNIAMAVVDMTSVKNITHSNGTVEMRAPEYNWTSVEKGIILSSFSYGRLLGPIGGILVGRIQGNTLYAFSTFANAVLTIFKPFSLYVNFYLFAFFTALTGTSESFAYAGVADIWVRWIPPTERAKTVCAHMISLYVGSMISFVAAGWILKLWGWETLFYISGGASLIWFFIWCLVVKNDPADDKHVSDKELKYIKERVNLARTKKEKFVIPWKGILTCAPIWVVALSKVCLASAFVLSVLYLPQYIKDTNDIDITKIGYLSLIPSLSSVVALPIFGFLSDYIRAHKILKLTTAYKLFESIGLLSGTFSFIVAGLWPNFISCFVCFCTYKFFHSAALLVNMMIAFDLAPQYSAFIHSILNLFYTVGLCATPSFVGFVVTSHSQAQWSVCFLTVGIIFAISASLFLKYGSGKLQPWAKDNIDKNQKHETKDGPLL